MGEKGEYDLKLDMNPFMEFDKDLGYHIRRNSFVKKTKAYPVTLKSGDKVPGIISYDLNEGIVRSNRGDILINKWGFRGPYVAKEKPNYIYRIVTMGGSTTAGKYENEETYPRLLERMLNGQNDETQNYQVLNYGVWGYNSCNLKTLYKQEIIKFNPDMIIIMSGWNDIIKQGQKKFMSIDDYCNNNYSALSNSNIYRLLEFWLKTPRQKKQSPDRQLNNLGQNAIYYLKNMREIISISQKRNILVGVVDLPALYETKTLNQDLKKLIQFSNQTLPEMEYYRNAGLKMNELINQIATEHPNTFPVAHALSFGSKGKEIFFSDNIHTTGSGNRILAYNIYETIKRVKNNKNLTKIKLLKKSMHKNKLEVEYLKSIFTSFEMEDLSYTTCIITYVTCNVVSTLNQAFDEEKNIQGTMILPNEYVSSVVEHSLGLILNFSEKISQPRYFKVLETALTSATLMIPNFSPTYWVLSRLYSLNGKDDLALNMKNKAIQLNPLLQGFSFDKAVVNFRGSIKNFSMIRDLDEFINSLNEEMPQGVYQSFKNIQETKLSRQKPSQSVKEFFKAYYISPILVRSIFERALNYLISINEFELALKLVAKLKTIKPEYDFEKIFGDYERKIKKAKLAYAN